MSSGFEFLGNTGREWLTAIGLALLVAAALLLLQWLLRFRVKRLARLTSTVWDDLVLEVLGRTHILALLIFAAVIGSLALELPAKVRAALVTVAVITLLLQGGLWVSHLWKTWIRQTTEERRETDPASAVALNATGWIGRLVLWSLVLLLILDNLGIDITALVAGLGVGGVAVALALQNVLGDLFAFLAIVLDKPFVVGDFLTVDSYLGSVEYVGLKTTRLRSLSGEQLVMSNADLLKSRLRNYGRMQERRVVFALGVTYQTPRDKLREIPGIIQAAIEAQEKTRFDRSHFKEYGDFALNFETVYYVVESDYRLYMDIQQAINLAIHERFEAEGIEFAYPTQTVFLSRPEGQE